MLEIRNLTAGYPGREVLKNQSLSIPRGQITAIVGPNGSGKTTLLKALAGLIPVTGEILMGTENLAVMSPGERAKRLAYLPQNRTVPEITAERLVLHGRFPHLSYPRRYRPEDYRIAKEAMEQMGVAPFTRRQLQSLSGGERQRVYLAMVLAQQTPMILMDEPTGFLDIAHKFDVIRMARELKKRGKTVVLVLHELDLALNSADRVVVMERGVIRKTGTGEDVYQSGILPEVFRVQVEKVETGGGTQYCFLPETGAGYE